MLRTRTLAATATAAALVALLPMPAVAQTSVSATTPEMRHVEAPTLPAAPPPGPPYPAGVPRLTVLISVDQFSADLFAEHRDRYTGGFSRLLTGAVFPSGYQSHAATETCPGHSRIPTGCTPTTPASSPTPGSVHGLDGRCLDRNPCPKMTCRW